MFRRVLMLVTVVAVMAALVAASATMALAAKPEDKGTFTVTCPGFIIGQGEPFTQTLPTEAQFGSAKSIEQTNLRSPEDQCQQILPHPD